MDNNTNDRSHRRSRLLDQLLSVRNARGLTWPEKSVLYVFITYADAHGEAFPSVATLAAGAGLGERTARDALAQLETKAVLVRTGEGAKGGRKSARRKFLPESLTNLAPQPRGSCAPPLREPHTTPAAAAPEPSSNHQSTTQINHSAVHYLDPDRELLELEEQISYPFEPIGPNQTPDPEQAERERQRERERAAAVTPDAMRRKREAIRAMREVMHGMGKGPEPGGKVRERLKQLGVMGTNLDKFSSSPLITLDRIEDIKRGIEAGAPPRNFAAVLSRRLLDIIDNAPRGERALEDKHIAQIEALRRDAARARAFEREQELEDLRGA